jgi:hypothetical protein
MPKPSVAAGTVGDDHVSGGRFVVGERDALRVAVLFGFDQPAAIVVGEVVVGAVGVLDRPQRVAARVGGVEEDAEVAARPARMERDNAERLVVVPGDPVAWGGHAQEVLP